MAIKKVKLRDTSNDYAEFVPVPSYLKKEHITLNLNKGLHIRIYGEPFSDSRPKPNKWGGIELRNLNLFRPVFKQLYQKSELLQNLVILSPYIMEAKFYKNPTQNDQKRIKKDAKLMNFLNKGMLYDISRKDVDNMLKIHNDILLQDEFRILLDDAWNIGFEKAYKILTDGEMYADIYLYFSTKPNSNYEWQIIKSTAFVRWQICEKYMLMNKIPMNKRINHIKKIFDNEVSSLKKYKDVKGLIDRFLGVIEEYSAESIKSMVDMNSHVFTKMDAQFKAILLITKGHQMATEIAENKNIGGELCAK